MWYPNLRYNIDYLLPFKPLDLSTWGRTIWILWLYSSSLLMTHSIFFFRLNIGKCTESQSSRFVDFIEIKFACNRYFTSVSTGSHDIWPTNSAWPNIAVCTQTTQNIKTFFLCMCALKLGYFKQRVLFKVKQRPRRTNYLSLNRDVSQVGEWQVKNAHGRTCKKAKYVTIYRWIYLPHARIVVALSRWDFCCCF